MNLLIMCSSLSLASFVKLPNTKQFKQQRLQPQPKRQKVCKRAYFVIMYAIQLKT